MDFQQQLEEDGFAEKPHFCFDVRAHLNANLPSRWIGCTFHNDSPLLTWPPRSPDLTPCNFFLWGYIKDHVYVRPMPRDLPQLRPRIWRQSLLSTARCCNVCGKNLITGLTSAVSPRVDILSTCKVGHKLGLCWHAPLLRDHPGYCTTEVGNPRGTYELPCILPWYLNN